MIIGIGNDLCDIRRIEKSLERFGDRFVQRVFTDVEQAKAAKRPYTRAGTLAKRFAAKEALAKALGAPSGMLWQDAEVHRGPDGRPHFEVRGTVAAAVDALGITSIHVSLSHDAGIASAVVVAEAREGSGPPPQPGALP